MMSALYLDRIEGIREEIEALRTELINRPFDSDFQHRAQMTRISRHKLNEELGVIIREMETEAAGIRRQVEMIEKQVREAVAKGIVDLRELQLLEAERNRENHLRILALREEREAEAANADAETSETLDEKGGGL